MLFPKSSIDTEAEKGTLALNANNSNLKKKSFFY